MQFRSVGRSATILGGQKQIGGSVYGRPNRKLDCVHKFKITPSRLGQCEWIEGDKKYWPTFYDPKKVESQDRNTGVAERLIYFFPGQNIGLRHNFQRYFPSRKKETEQ